MINQSINQSIKPGCGRAESPDFVLEFSNDGFTDLTVTADTCFAETTFDTTVSYFSMTDCVAALGCRTGAELPCRVAPLRAASSV